MLIIMELLIIWGCGYLFCFILDSRRQLWRRFLEEDNSAEDSDPLSFSFSFSKLIFSFYLLDLGGESNFGFLTWESGTNFFLRHRKLKEPTTMATTTTTIKHARHGSARSDVGAHGT